MGATANPVRPESIPGTLRIFRPSIFTSRRLVARLCDGVVLSRPQISHGILRIAKNDAEELDQ